MIINLINDSEKLYEESFPIVCRACRDECIDMYNIGIEI